MNLFNNQLKSGKAFLWKYNSSESRFLGIPDDEINGVQHIYIDTHVGKGKFNNDMKYGGVLIHGVIYKYDYLFESNLKSFQIKLGSIEDIQKEMHRQITERATQSVYQRILELSQTAIAFAESDLARMKSEPQSEDEKRHTYFHYINHNPIANTNILEDLIYRGTNEGNYAMGVAYNAFYKGGFIKEDESTIVKAIVSERDVIRYLATKDKEALLTSHVEAAVDAAKKELENNNNYLVNAIARNILADQYHRELITDTQGEHYLIKAVYDSCHAEELAEIKSINITVEVEGEHITFKYDRNMIRRTNEISTWHINPVKARSQIEDQLKKRCKRLDTWSTKLCYDDITIITYRKNELYKKQKQNNVIL